MYSGSTVKLEALLSNLDALRPGEYPVRVEVVAPMVTGCSRSRSPWTCPIRRYRANRHWCGRCSRGKCRSAARPVRTSSWSISSAARRQRAVEITFNVFNPADMPAVESEVVLWGKDEGLAKWLAEHDIRTRPFAPGQAAKRELILVGTGGGDAAAFRELAVRMAQGASVVFLSPAVFARDANPVGWLPFAHKGTMDRYRFLRRLLPR